MFSFDELTEEEEEEIITKVAEKIRQYKMEGPAILFLETSKPISYIGIQLGRAFFSPLLMILKDDLNISAEKILLVFEKRDNIEKLLQLIETGHDIEKEWK